LDPPLTYWSSDASRNATISLPAQQINQFTFTRLAVADDDSLICGNCLDLFFNANCLINGDPIQAEMQ
jgi:hypothetical protein